MSNSLIKTGEYRDWLKDLKLRVRQAQVKAAVRVNSELLLFYWELGADIVERQKTAKWGSGFLKQLSADLMAEFPDMKGFSEPNLRFIIRWFKFYSEGLCNSVTACDRIESSIVQLVKVPWGHNRVIISKCVDVEEALYYVNKTIEHHWSRSVLVHQIESGLFQREGKAISNFADYCFSCASVSWIAGFRRVGLLMERKRVVRN